MNTEDKHNQSLSFMGEITASVTHELNNVLGTIEQVTGLIEDLAAVDFAQNSEIAGKLLDVVEKVARQSDRGTSLIKRLNRFAHLNDEPFGEYNIAELLETMIYLSERAAKMNKVELVAGTIDRDIIIGIRPLATAKEIYDVIKLGIRLANPSEKVEIDLHPCDNGGEMVVGFHLNPESEVDVANIQTNIAEDDLPYQLSGVGDTGRMKITLSITES